MKNTHRISTKSVVLPAVVTALALALAACGGGGGSPSNTASYSLTGVAATGAALANAPVYLKDAAGNEPTGQSESAGTALVTTDSSGNFTFDASLLSGLTSPVLIKVTGRTVLDNGDDAFTVLHSIAHIDGSGVNVTPLTEVATTMALAKDPATVFANPGSSMTSLSSSAGQTASAALMAKLAQTDPQLTNLDVFKDSLDPAPTADLSNASAGKIHDMLLDSVALVKSGATFSLVDRNGPSEDYASQPALNLTVGDATPTSVNGTMAQVSTDNALDSTKLDAFIARLNAAFASQTCDFSQTVNSCAGVVGDATIFSAAYKHQGMPADIWLKKWVGEALAIEDFSGLQVSLKSAFVGAWNDPASGQDVVRVLLKWKAGADDNIVFRSLLLTEENGNVVAFGNQRDYFTWVKPTTVYNPDADNTYPHYPRYENGFSLVAGHWYAGHKNVVVGAHFSGPGLPTNRSTSQNNAYGEEQNPNGITTGVEMFDMRSTWGCSNLSIDPSAYVEKNTRNWSTAWNSGDPYDGSIRYKAGNPTCDPKFDFLRYHGITTGDGTVTNMPGDFTAPKRGDDYTVVLYLSKAEVDSLQLTLPNGAGSATVTKPDGTSVDVYTVQTRVKLQTNPIAWREGGFPSTMFAGITDATRARLVGYGARDDRTIDWARNFVDLETGSDANGAAITSRFVNFNAGIYESSYDSMRGTDSYSGVASGSLVNGVEMGFQPYWRLITNWGAQTKPDLCGTTVKHRGADVKVYAQSCSATADCSQSSNWIMSSCPAVTGLAKNGDGSYQISSGNYSEPSTNKIYRFWAARGRVKFALDRWEFINATQKTRTITGASIVARERVGAQALCSVQKGFWSYRHAMVQLLDVNGRGLMEKRQVWSDFPEKAATLNATDGATWTRANDVSRPNMDTDDVYLTPLFLTSQAPASGLTPYNTGTTTLTSYQGEKGFIIPVQEMNANGECVDVAWQAGQ